MKIFGLVLPFSMAFQWPSAGWERGMGSFCSPGNATGEK